MEINKIIATAHHRNSSDDVPLADLFGKARHIEGAIRVSMPDGSTQLLTTLLSQANHKQEKGAGFLSGGLTLTPRGTGRSGRNLCPFATRGCAASCFADYDRLAWPKNKRVAVARTRLLAQAPAQFFALLEADLARAHAQATRLGVQLVCRLNVVSDVPFERECPELFTRFPDVQFMDYTKDVLRVLNPERPANYHLTFSRSEANESDCRRVLTAGGNVAVVFRKPPFPGAFWDYPVIDGDRNDLRFLDPNPCIVGLKAKGKGAREDRTGFVLHPQLLPPPEAVACTATAKTTTLSSTNHRKDYPMTKPKPDPMWIHITVSGGLVQRVFCDVPAVVFIERFDTSSRHEAASLAKWDAESLTTEELLRLLKLKAIRHRIVIQEE